METVLVLMSTYNGEKYLKEQLQSLSAQKGVEMNILVRDDGSTDSTHNILNTWQNEGLLKWYTGENMKPAYSFIDLINRASGAEYYAFCDQDDIWDNDKLQVAVNMLKQRHADLYYSSYTTVDKDLRVLERNVQKPVMQTLGQAMVYASVTGCTMVFSKRVLELAQKHMPNSIMMHDSWLFKIALAMDLKPVYDSESHILYRQHSSNVVGNHQSFVKRWNSRINRMLNGTRKRYEEAHSLYLGYSDMMRQEQLEYLTPVIDYAHKSICHRLKIAFNKKYKTNVISSDVLFKLAVILKRY